MSFATRLKARREELNISRADLANLLHVTPSAISNYENAVSSPKAEVLYSLFDALDCDANYLFQDEMNDLNNQSIDNISDGERELIKKYRGLSDHDKKIIQFILNLKE